MFNSGFQAIFIVTGGGLGALYKLLRSPGASRFVVNAHVPYSSEALTHVLGEKPEQAVSPVTARALAHKAFFEGTDDPSRKRVGVACTATLQTDRVRRGKDRAFLCIKTIDTEKLYALYHPYPLLHEANLPTHIPGIEPLRRK